MPSESLEATALRATRALGRPRTLLDVGCAAGTRTAWLRERGTRVTGVDGSVDAARAALDEVYAAQLDSPAAFGALAAVRFDTVLFGAVLSAVRDPLALLRQAVPLLEDGGHVVVVLTPDVGLDVERTRALLAEAGLEVLWASAAPALSRYARAVAPSVVDSPDYAAWVRPVDAAVSTAAGPMLETPHVVVARLTPRKRTLSLTVGMISMNEEGAVGGVIDDIKRRVPQAEVLLVDSSKDRTPDIATERGARVLRQVPPQGYGPAMARLLYAATTDVIITMDCDGTYPSDRIADLLARVEAGADLVNATRTAHRPHAMPLPNYVANRVFAGAAGVLHGLQTTDVHSGMRAYRTSMLRGIDPEERGPALPVELYVVPARRGYRLEETEIDYFERIGTSTLQRWQSTVWTFRRLVSAWGHGGHRVP